MTTTQMAGELGAEARSGVPIRLSRVSKTFGEDGDSPFQALKEVSTDIEPGEFISVVGPSGCGKSTLMLMVAGLLVEEIEVDLPRPRPIVLGDAPEFAAYVDRIYGHFERMGVLHGIDVRKAKAGGS